MLFRRRERRAFSARLRDLLWPRGGLRRSGRYIGYRLMRLPGSPHSLAGGFAWGAAISLTPFVGVHILLAWGLCLLTRCNLLAAVIGTALGNPWSFPFIWAGTYVLGTHLLGIDASHSSPVQSLLELSDGVFLLSRAWLGIGGAAATTAPVDGARLWQLFWSVFLPMLAGGLPLAAALWLACYLPLKRLVARYQAARRARLLAALTRPTAKEAGASVRAMPQQAAPRQAGRPGKERADASD